MEILWNLIAINVMAANQELKGKINEETEKYLANVSSASLITNDAKFWNNFEFSFPLIVQDYIHNTVSTVPVAAFIIDVREWKTSFRNIAPPNRHFDSKYVFVTVEEHKENVSSTVKSFGPCHVIILTIKGENVETSYLSDPCRGISNESAVNLIDHQCSANASFLDLPPNVIFENNKMAGFEGLMAQTACDHLGITLNYINRHETGYGLFSPPSGLQGDAGTGRSLLSFGALYAFHYRYVNAETIFGCHNVPLAWAVPIAAGESSPTWFIILVSEFSNTVWAAVFIVSLSFIPLSKYFYLKKEEKVGSLHIFALLLGIAQKLIFQKSLSLIILFFGFMITSYYRSIMSSKLTVPAVVPEITTLQQLADSELKLTGPPTVGDILSESARASSQDSPLRNLESRYVKNLESLDVLLPQIAEFRATALLRHGDNLYYNAQKIPKAKGKIHMVEESVYTFKAITLMPKHSCLAPIFQKTYDRLCQSGLGAKWQKDMTSKQKPIQDGGPRKIAMEHITGFLYLLVLGWIISTLSFVYEITRKLSIINIWAVNSHGV